MREGMGWNGSELPEHCRPEEAKDLLTQSHRCLPGVTSSVSPHTQTLLCLLIRASNEIYVLKRGL